MVKSEELIITTEYLTL